MTARIAFSKECPQCGGTGDIACLTCESKGLEDCMLQPGCVSDPCPSCVGGWLPDDGLRSVAGDALSKAVFDAPAFDEADRLVADEIATAVLVAAARYQAEGGDK